MRVLFLALLVPALVALPARAQESLQPPEQRAAELLALAEAYQSGYFQVVALCCYQLYTATGIIATDFANGYINGETALYALDENGLLHSACVTTLAQIQQLTPAGDAAAHDQIARLMSLLISEEELLAAVRQTLVEPTEENAARAELAREQVAGELAGYVDANASVEEKAGP